MLINCSNVDLIGIANVYFKRSQEKKNKLQHSFWEAGSTLSVGVHRAAELQGNSWTENKTQQHAVVLF